MPGDYETIELLQAIELRNPITKFFSDFFQTTNTHLSEKIQVDVRKSRRRMAPFVANRSGGKLMSRDGYKTFELSTPKISLERQITVDDVSIRGFGEDIYSTKRPEERATEMLAKDMTDMEEYISNRKEWMCRSVIIDGKMDVSDVDAGVDINVDYNFTNKNNLVGGAMWNSNTSDPTKNLKDWRRHIINKCGTSPSIVLMGNEAYERFIWNDKVKELLNLRNMNFGSIIPKIINNALTFRGDLNEIGMQIYTYDDWFVDDDGNEQAFMPDNKVLILPEQIGSIEYGSVIQQENGILKTYEGTLVPKVMVDDRNDSKIVRLTSRPLPVPFDVDSWYVATVI